MSEFIAGALKRRKRRRNACDREVGLRWESVEIGTAATIERESVSSSVYGHK